MPIINGVEVEGCIYYQPDKIADCGMFKIGDFKCDGQICLYKQLQRVKAENEKLKNILKEIRDLKKSQGIKDDVLKMIERALNIKKAEEQ